MFERVFNTQKPLEKGSNFSCYHFIENMYNVYKNQEYGSRGADTEDSPENFLKFSKLLISQLLSYKDSETKTNILHELIDCIDKEERFRNSSEFVYFIFNVFYKENKELLITPDTRSTTPLQKLILLDQMWSKSLIQKLFKIMEPVKLCEILTTPELKSAFRASMLSESGQVIKEAFACVAILSVLSYKKIATDALCAKAKLNKMIDGSAVLKDKSKVHEIYIANKRKTSAFEDKYLEEAKLLYELKFGSIEGKSKKEIINCIYEIFNDKEIKNIIKEKSSTKAAQSTAKQEVKCAFSSQTSELTHQEKTRLGNKSFISRLKALNIQEKNNGAILRNTAYELSTEYGFSGDAKNLMENSLQTDEAAKKCRSL